MARRKSGVSSSNFSDSELDIELNVGYHRLCALLAHIEPKHFYEERSKFNLIQNSGLYSNPDDCISLLQVRLAYSTPSTDGDYKVAVSYDVNEVHDPIDEENVPTANPIVEFMQTRYRIKPKPSSDVTDGGMLFYIAMPSALSTSAAIPIIPIAYHEQIAVYGAKAMAFKYEKKWKYAGLKEEWEKTIGELTQTAAELDQNRPLRFKSLSEINGGALTRREL